MGHSAEKCWAKEREERRMKVVAVVAENRAEEPSQVPGQDRCVVACVAQRSETKSLNSLMFTSLDTYKPFIPEGTIKMAGRIYEVKVLRDTGASRSLLLNPNPGTCQANHHIVLRGAGGAFLCTFGGD